MIKITITSLLLCASLTAAEVTMPKHQKFYISGIEFDTRVYCADFTKVIEEQAQKIKALEAEVAQLRLQEQKRLSETLKQEHQEALKKAAQNKRISETKSKIIISDKPIH
jgi:TolA-binding protein